jgi:23S rRNA pseudouridine1911/1915/1917 synthase
MRVDELEILYEDNHLLAINKPPGLPTMGVAAGDPSVSVLARQYIKRRYQKPGNVYLGIVSRLDAGASGVLLLARTSKAAARLTEQFRSRKVRKTYWALVSGVPMPPEGEWCDWIVKDETRQRMTIVRPGSSAGKEARLSYRTLRPVGRGTLVEVDLQTGRKHQIRLQFAERELPLWGERKYGRGWPLADGPRRNALGLHARRLQLEHPVRKEPLDLLAPLPASWRHLGIES